MLNFDCLDPLIFVKAPEKKRSMVGFLDRSTGKYGIGQFHDEEPITVHGKLVGLTYYGFMTFYIDDLSTLEELTDVLKLYADDLNKDNMWWEKDDDLELNPLVVQLASFLNEEMTEEEGKAFTAKFVKEYNKKTKGSSFKILKN